MRILPALITIALLASCNDQASVPRQQTAVKARVMSTARLPSPGEAQEIVASSPELSEYEFTNAAYSLPISHAVMNEPARTAARDLASAGWIAFDGNGDVVLTPRARSDKRWLVRPNGFIDIVPLGKKEFGRVEAVRPNPDGTAAAGFSWKWLPNEIGSAFRSGVVKERFTSEQRATATLLWDGTAWTVLKIEKRP